MVHLYRLTCIKMLLGFIALMSAGIANASLLDCAQSPVPELYSGGNCLAVSDLQHTNTDSVYGVKDAMPVAVLPAAAKIGGFQVNRMSNSGIPGSAPLLGLVCTLLVVLLVRAKAFNTK